MMRRKQSIHFPLVCLASSHYLLAVNLNPTEISSSRVYKAFSQNAPQTHREPYALQVPSHI